MKLKDLRSAIERSKVQQEFPIITEIYIKGNDGQIECLTEGKWYSGRFPQNIRQDEPTHGVGITHAHIHDRKGNEIGVVKFDGTPSHGTKIKLHPKDHKALITRGFDIPENGIVECTLIEGANLQALFG